VRGDEGDDEPIRRKRPNASQSRPILPVPFDRAAI
jgi:hypothetical protein